MKTICIRISMLALCILLTTGLVSCSGSKKDRQKKQTDVSNSITIRMYGNLDKSYLPFLNCLQEKFPEMKLEYEYQWDEAYYNEPLRRNAHQDGSDICVVRGNTLAAMTKKGYLLNLTGEKFSPRYHISTMSGLNENGQIYGLPLPSDIRCLACNRGILLKYGITKMPETIDELLDICRSLTAEGQGAMMLDKELYYMILSTSWLYGIEGYNWITEYNKGLDSMAGTPASDAWERFKDLAKVSGCSLEDASALPARKTDLMIEGKYVFRLTNISNIKYMQNQSRDLDLAALPYLGEKKENQWVYYSQPKALCYFAANALLDLPENENKKKLVLEIFDWISTSEAQKLLASCGGSVASYVNDVDLDQGELMEYVNPVIKQGHLSNSEDLERGVNETVGSCVPKILTGEITPLDAVKLCDAQNVAYTPPEEITGLDEVIGYAEETIYWRKPAAVTVGSSMSQLAAMAMAFAYPDADFALAMAKNTASTLYSGDITLGDVMDCAKGENDSELVIVETTGQKIKEVIEMGIGKAVEPNFILPYGIEGAGRLLHPVGFTYQADIKREQGDKVISLTLDNGEPLNMDDNYTIIVSRLMVDVVSDPNFSDCKVIGTNKHLGEVMVSYIRDRRSIKKPEIGFSITGMLTPIYQF